MGSASQTVAWYTLNIDGDLLIGHPDFPVQTANDPPEYGLFVTPDIADNVDYRVHVNDCTAREGYYCQGSTPNPTPIVLRRVVSPSFPAADLGDARGCLKDCDGDTLLLRYRMKWEHQTEGWDVETMSSGWGDYYIRLPAGVYNVYLDGPVWNPGTYELSGACEITGGQVKQRNFRHPTQQGG